MGEPDLAQLKKGDIIQILRKGYYICDIPFDAATKQPCRLLNIPDGTTKEKPTALKTTTTSTTNAAAAASTTAGPEVDQLVQQITQQGDLVRQLKGNKSAPKVRVTAMSKTPFNDLCDRRMSVQQLNNF